MSWNYKVRTFVVGATTFNSEATGVYVERGSATGMGSVDRIEVTPWGAIYDMDGTDDADLILPRLWNDFVFVGAHPNAHAQYINLMSLMGKHGTLSIEIPTDNAGADVLKTCTARLLPLPADSQWEAPYKTSTQNWLMVRGIWQLKSTPA